MNEIIERIKEKIKDCNEKNREGRIRKGAYVDCLVMINEEKSGNVPECNHKFYGIQQTCENCGKTALEVDCSKKDNFNYVPCKKHYLIGTKNEIDNCDDCKKEKSSNLPEANRNAVLADVLAEIEEKINKAYGVGFCEIPKDILEEVLSKYFS